MEYKKLKDRLMKRTKVDERECWNWTGCKDKKGYGYIMFNGKLQIVRKVHRVSFELFNGPIPHGKMILHNCDNPSCINPEHLRIGTAKDNSMDAVSRNRLHKGLDRYNAKIGDTNAWIVKFGISAGMSVSSLAKHFDVSRQSIKQIRDDITYKHVKFGEQYEV